MSIKMSTLHNQTSGSQPSIDSIRSSFKSAVVTSCISTALFSTVVLFGVLKNEVLAMGVLMALGFAGMSYSSYQDGKKGLAALAEGEAEDAASPAKAPIHTPPAP